MNYILNNGANRISYIHALAKAGGGHLPAVMFLGGFRSDMEGTKALYLEAKCKARGQEFIRFDYTGHGLSGGVFEDGTIGIWKNDAREVLDKILQGDVILVGSSMGGWISLLLMLERAERIKGMVGIASAPDFTKEIVERLSEEQNEVMMRDGHVEVPNDYSDDPYVFTRDLIVDGKKNCLLEREHKVFAPMILVQGKKDADVPWKKALKIKECFKAPSCDIVFVDDGDHRLSKPEELDIIWQAVESLSPSS